MGIDMALGPVQAFTGPDTKLQWTDLYTSDNINKAFLGMPNGVYLGFTPVVSGLTLTLQTDTSIIFSAQTGGDFVVGTTVTGGFSGATAVIRLVNSPLPGRGFMAVDTVTGTFSLGETINGPGVSATLDAITTDSVSVGKVDTTSTYAGGRTEEALTVIIASDIVLDFSPGTITDGTYYVLLRATYEIGQQTTAEVVSIKDSPPDGRLTTGLCKVTKFGGSLALEPIAPENRTDPYADVRTRNGFMPADSIQDLTAALTTTAEVIAAHLGYDGADFGTFDASNPQTTGLPGRLNSDLEQSNMANRMGKELLVVQGNDYTPLAIPTGNTINISGSFAAKIRDHQPFRDVTNGLIPDGLIVPRLIEPVGFRGLTLTVGNASGSFAIGDKVEGQTGGGSAIIHAVNGDLIDVDDIGKAFFIGETLLSSGNTATLTAVDVREGAVSADENGLTGDPDHNVVIILDTLSGRKPVDTSGSPIYGRLLFGPSGSSGPGGGDPGELLVAANAGEQINFTNGSTVITGNNIDFTEYLLPGDIIEGDDGRFYEVSPSASAVQASTVFLSTGNPYVGPNSSSGLGVGSGARRRFRFIMKLVTKTGGTESDAVIDTESIEPGASLRVFFPAWLTRSRSNYSASLELRTSGDTFGVPLESSTVPGVGYNAAIGPSTQLIGAIKSVQVAGIDPGAGNYHTINYALTAGSATLSQTAPGVIDINAVGPPGGPGGAGPSPPGAPGPAGSGFNNIFVLTQKVIDLRFVGVGTTDTDTFDFSPKKIRFFTITSSFDRDFDGSAGSVPGAGIIAVSPTPTYDTDSTLTFEYTQNPYAGNLRVVCAAATD